MDSSKAPQLFASGAISGIFGTILTSKNISISPIILRSSVARGIYFPLVDFAETKMGHVDSFPQPVKTGIAGFISGFITQAMIKFQHNKSPFIPANSELWKYSVLGSLYPVTSFALNPKGSMLLDCVITAPFIALGSMKYDRDFFKEVRKVASHRTMISTFGLVLIKQLYETVRAMTLELDDRSKIITAENIKLKQAKTVKNVFTDERSLTESHNHHHMDWWMFPLRRAYYLNEKPSFQSRKFIVDALQIRYLMRNELFMKNYIASLNMMNFAYETEWKKKKFVYEIRLAKIMYSLHDFISVSKDIPYVSEKNKEELIKIGRKTVNLIDENNIKLYGTITLNAYVNLKRETDLH